MLYNIIIASKQLTTFTYQCWLVSNNNHMQLTVYIDTSFLELTSAYLCQSDILYTRLRLTITIIKVNVVYETQKHLFQNNLDIDLVSTISCLQDTFKNAQSTTSLSISLTQYSVQITNMLQYILTSTYSVYVYTFFCITTHCSSLLLTIQCICYNSFNQLTFWTGNTHLMCCLIVAKQYIYLQK